MGREGESAYGCHPAIRNLAGQEAVELILVENWIEELKAKVGT